MDDFHQSLWIKLELYLPLELFLALYLLLDEAVQDIPEVHIASQQGNSCLPHISSQPLSHHLREFQDCRCDLSLHGFHLLAR